MVGGQLQYQLGIFWAIFVPIVIACNDSWAYICGKTFGRTPLIKLSPNKTLEGFLGGGLVTFVMVYLLSHKLFAYEKLICVNYRLDKLPFEQIECNLVQSDVFQDTVSFDELKISYAISPALIACLYFGVFASLVSPFAGFFASGMKRAYQIKDFSNTLPGHGGFLDRFDCTLFANIFALGVLSQILYKDYLQVDTLSTMFDELNPSQQSELLQWM